MIQTLKYRGQHWDYRVQGCLKDNGSPAPGFSIEVQHPGNGVWEHAGYSEYNGSTDIQDIVQEFADSELDG